MKPLQRFGKILQALVLLSLVAAAAFSLTGMNASAQEAASIQQNGVDPEAYITKVNTDKAEYVAGETVRGSIEVFNGTRTSLGSVLYTVALGNDFDDFGNPYEIFGTDQPKNVALGPKEKRSFPFEYKIPMTASGQDVRIIASLSLPSGQPLGNGTSEAFVVTGGTGLLETSGAFVRPTVNGKPGEQFELQTGVPLYKEAGNHPTAASVYYTFDNTSKDAVEVYPKVTIYRRSVDSGQTVTSFGLAQTSYVIKPSSSLPLSFAIPFQDQVPGVYEGKLELMDKSGAVRNEVAPFRYVVQGPSAMIQSVVSETTKVKKDQPFSVQVGVTGEAQDIYYQFASTSIPRTLKTIVTITDPSGTVVAVGQAMSQVGGVPVNVDVPMIALEDASSLEAHAKVYFNDTELYSYDEVLSVESQSALSAATTMSLLRQAYEENETLINIVLLVLLFSIVSLVVYRLGMAKPSAIMLLVTAGLCATAVFAQYQDPMKGSSADALTLTSLSVGFNTPAVDQVYEPGADLKISGQAFFVNCFNRDTTAQVIMYDGAGNQSPAKSLGSWAHRTRKKDGETKLSEDKASNRPNFGYTFKAPMTPGNYVAKIYVKVSAGGTSRGSIWVSRIAYQPYKVQAANCASTNTCVTDNGTGGTGGTGTTGTTNDANPSLCGNLNGKAIAEGASVSPTAVGACGAANTTNSVTVAHNSGLWTWKCKDSDSSPVSCQAKCASGTFYCPSSNTCSATCADWCSDSIPGNPSGPQTDRSAFNVLVNGSCTTGPIIGDFDLGNKYADKVTDKCPVFWTVNKMDAGTTKCELNSATVSCIDTAGAFVPVGVSTFKATLTIDGGDAGDTETSEEAQVKCVRNPAFIER